MIFLSFLLGHSRRLSLPDLIVSYFHFLPILLSCSFNSFLQVKVIWLWIEVLLNTGLKDLINAFSIELSASISLLSNQAILRLLPSLANCCQR